MPRAYRAARGWKAGQDRVCSTNAAVVLANETDWEGWRKATRSLVLAGVAPEDVRWSVRSHDEEGDPLPEEHRQLSACRARWSRWRRWRSRRASAARFDLLYRLVWRANAGERV